MRYAIGAAAALLLLATPAMAQPDGRAANVELDWSAPSRCPTRADVVAEVMAIISESAVPARSVAARATVTQLGDHWHVEFDIHSVHGSGERSFDARSCRELGNAVALIIALALEPRANPPDPPAPSLPPEEPRAKPAPLQAVDNVRIGVAAIGSGNIGTLPRVAIGAGGAIVLLLQHARLEVDFNRWITEHAGYPSRPSDGVELGLTTFGGRACVALLATSAYPARTGASLSPCAGLGVNHLAASGYGDAVLTFARESTWMFVEAGALATWAFGDNIALRLDADAVVPLARPTFVALATDGSVAQVLHRPAALGSRLGLGVELRFF